MCISINLRRPTIDMAIREGTTRTSGSESNHLGYICSATRSCRGDVQSRCARAEQRRDVRGEEIGGPIGSAHERLREKAGPRGQFHCLHGMLIPYARNSALLYPPERHSSHRLRCHLLSTRPLFANRKATCDCGRQKWSGGRGSEVRANAS